MRTMPLRSRQPALKAGPKRQNTATRPRLAEAETINLPSRHSRSR